VTGTWFWMSFSRKSASSARQKTSDFSCASLFTASLERVILVLDNGDILFKSKKTLASQHIISQNNLRCNTLMRKINNCAEHKKLGQKEFLTEKVSRYG